MSGLTAAGRIVRHSLRRGWISLLVFALAAGGFQALVAASFPAIGGLTAVNAVVQSFPPGLRTLLRIAPNLQAGFALPEYLAFSWFHPVFLGLGAAFVVLHASDGLTGAVEGGAIYLVLSRPIPRWSFVVGKMVVLVIGAGVIVLVAWLGMVIGIVIADVGPLPLGRYGLVALVAWLLFGALGGGALIIASAASRTVVSGGVGSAWTLLAFVLDVIPSIATSPVAWLNPWHHYYPQEIVATGSVNLASLLTLLAWPLLATLIAVWIFGRRDLD
jgi:ABC-type transport system involved in multi-copper enzyme maturation permease subunit